VDGRFLASLEPEFGAEVVQQAYDEAGNRLAQARNARQWFRGVCESVAERMRPRLGMVPPLGLRQNGNPGPPEPAKKTRPCAGGCDTMVIDLAETPDEEMFCGKCKAHKAKRG
jgi:YD repeat-containing protein